MRKPSGKASRRAPATCDGRSSGKRNQSTRARCTKIDNLATDKKDTGSTLDQFFQLVFPTVVKALVQNLKAKLMLVKTFSELLPGNLLTRFLEITGDLALVLGIGVAFQVAAFDLDYHHAGDRFFRLPVLEHKIGVDAVLAKALNGEVF